MSDESPETRRRQGRKRPKKATPEYLERAGLWYLERYASSRANFERVLWRRVLKSAREHGTDPEEGRKAIDALAERLERAGLLNDRAYAESLARGLFRKGQSLAAIDRRLRQKGLGEEERESALAQFQEIPEEPDLAAAASYARRRRLGPYRPPGERQARREKDLAALARRGFRYDIARQVIDAEDTAELETLLREAEARL